MPFAGFYVHDGRRVQKDRPELRGYESRLHICPLGEHRTLLECIQFPKTGETGCCGELRDSICCEARTRGDGDAGLPFGSEVLSSTVIVRLSRPVRFGRYREASGQRSMRREL